MDRRTFTTGLLAAGFALPARPRALPESAAQVAPAPGVTVQRLDLARLVCFSAWHASGAYERFQRLVVWEGAQADVPFQRLNFHATRGVPDHRPARRYTLLVDGRPLAGETLAEGAEGGRFSLPLAGLAAGWHSLEIGGLEDGEACPRWFAYLLRDGAPPPATMPVCTGSFDIRRRGRAGEHAWAWVPARYQPTPSPLPRRDAAPFDAPADDLVVQPVGYHIEGNVHFPNVNRQGVVSTFGVHSYFWADLISRFPRVALLDGPRGVGALSMATHIGLGTATRDPDPASAPLRNVYVTDPWRLMRVADDGHVTTLAGWRHRGMASHFRDTERGSQDSRPGATLELVGDWSAVPRERRGFHELWGMAWDVDSLRPDPNAAPIREEENRRPHIGHPACFVTDSQNDRVCRITFDGRSHATPARVEEFLVGLKDPWDIVAWGRSVIVSERGAHRIAQYDARTGALQRVVLAGAALAEVPPATRSTVRRAPMEALRREPVVAPEGLYLLGDWLYFGSYAQQQVRRVHLTTGAVEVVVAEVPLTGNSRFIKFCVSDGSFGPHGTVFIQSWENSPPKIGHLPGGGRWRLRFPGFTVDGYGSAVAVGGGRMVFGSSRYGLWRVQRGPAIDVQKFRQGRDEYDAAWYPLTHGTGGFGHHGLPLPWGRSAAMDYYLECCGHARPRARSPVALVSTRPAEPGLSLPDTPTQDGARWSWFLGAFAPVADGHFDRDGFPFAASYAVRKPLPARARLGVTLHSSGGYDSFVKTPYGPFAGVDAEVRTQDGQAKERLDRRHRTEYWCYGPDGQPYPVRRVVALLEAVCARHPEIDVNGRGIVYQGNSMGNGGILHTMLLSSPWRERIAYARGSVGVFMPRQIAQRRPRAFPGWPPDRGVTQALWDAVDFSLRATRDPVVRAMHYRQEFSSNDGYSEGIGGSTQLAWVNLCETHRIGAVATWIRAGHGTEEKGVEMPGIKAFEVEEQDVTLDRAHPCFTHSSGNWPPTAAQRLDRAAHPRGHYNLGLVWDHGRIVDAREELVFPLRYVRHAAFGGGVPDQPGRITVDVTPRRARRFELRHGERLHWNWADGRATGTATVEGDTVTATGLPMVAGEGYRLLRFYRPTG